MILHDRTDIWSMCPACACVIYETGEVKDQEACQGWEGCMLTTDRTIEAARVYCFRLSTGQVVAVDLEDKPRVIGIAWRWDGTHVIATIDKRTVMLHRYLTNTTDRSIIIDHRHHDSCDNRKSQLRDATITTNRRNTRKHKGNSGYLGVYLDEQRGKYAASIQYKDATGKRYNRHLGYFPNTEEGEWAAAEAFNTAAKDAYGEFAVVNVRQSFVRGGDEGPAEEEPGGQ